MLKSSDLRGLSLEELREKAVSLKKNLMQLRFQQKQESLNSKTHWVRPGGIREDPDNH